MIEVIRQYLNRVQTRTNQIGVIVLLSLALVFYIVGRSHKPKESLVNGRYYNECCNVVVVRNGHMIYGGQDIQFKLESMKFGLTAYAKGSLSLSSIQASEKNREDDVIGFSKTDGKFAFVLLHDNHELVFRQID